MQNLHQSTWDHEILYTDRFLKDEQLLMRPFLSETKKNTNMAAIWMLKFIVCSAETTHEPLHSDKWTLVQEKIMEIPTSFISIIILFNAVFKYGDGAKFWVYVVINAEQLCVEFCNSSKIIPPPFLANLKPSRLFYSSVKPLLALLLLCTNSNVNLRRMTILK
jgi:hypothetical protein